MADSTKRLRSQVGYIVCVAMTTAFSTKLYAATEPPPLVTTTDAQLIPLATLPGPWSEVSAISESFEFDTNPLLVGGHVHAVSGSVTEPSFTLTGATPSARLDWTTRLDLNAFDQPHFSSVDLHTNLIAQQNWQTGYIKLTGLLDYDTTRTSELTTSGVNVAGIRHTGLSLAPEAGWKFSLNDTAIVDGSYQQSNYADKSLFTDFRFFQFNPQIVHTFSVKDSGSLQVQASRYETVSGLPNSQEAVGAGFGWQHVFSSRLSALGSAGIEYSKGDYSVPTSFRLYETLTQTNINYFYNFELKFAGFRDNFQLSASRNLLPEGIGLVTLQTSLKASETHRLSPRWSVGASFSFNSNDYAGAPSLLANIAGRTKDFIQFQAFSSYNLTDRLTLQPSYRFRTRDFIDEGSNAISHTFMLQLVFTPHAAVLGL